MPLEKMPDKFVLRPMEAIAIIIINFPILTNRGEKPAGRFRKVFIIAAAIKNNTNQGNTFAKLKLPVSLFFNLFAVYMADLSPKARLKF